MEVKYTLEVTLSLSVNYIVRRTCWRKIFYLLNISKDQAASKNNCKGENESFPEDSRSLAPKWINQTNLVSCTCYNLPATCNPFCWQSISESEKKIVVSLYSFDISVFCSFDNLLATWWLHTTLLVDNLFQKGFGWKFLLR